MSSCSFWLSGTLALDPGRQSTQKSKTKNVRLASLASNPLVTVPILELWAKNGLSLETSSLRLSWTDKREQMLNDKFLNGYTQGQGQKIKVEAKPMLPSRGQNFGIKAKRKCKPYRSLVVCIEPEVSVLSSKSSSVINNPCLVTHCDIISGGTRHHYLL